MDGRVLWIDFGSQTLMLAPSTGGPATAFDLHRITQSDYHGLRGNEYVRVVGYVLRPSPRAPGIPALPGDPVIPDATAEPLTPRAVAHLGGASFEESVEEFLPSRGMYARRAGQDAVQIEENRVVVARRDRHDGAGVASGAEPFRAVFIKDVLPAERGATRRDGPG